MDFLYRGKVAWKFEDYFPGDLIVGRMGLIEKDPEKLKNYLLTSYDPEFPKKFKKGDLMVAGRYFGGTRDHGAMRALQALGVSCIIAESFGRPILRRCITYALPALECVGISMFANQYEELEVNLRTGEIKNLTTGQSAKTSPAPEVQLEIIEAGGFIPYLRKKIKEEQNP